MAQREEGNVSEDLNEETLAEMLKAIAPMRLTIKPTVAIIEAPGGPMPDDFFSPTGQKLERPEYLGDGVYVGFDRPMAQIWLWSDRENGRHWIALDAETLATLERYLAPLRAIGAHPPVKD
jgi:hypothetical protein